MNATKLTILLSCILSAMTCSATKYQIKVLNTPTITIDNQAAKVGDWFDDSSVISWTKENQAMRVLSDENKVYTLSAKLYKEAKAKKFSDFIAYTKPLAVRGSNDDSLITKLQEVFDQDFIMLDEIVIDLSGIELPEGCSFLIVSQDGHQKHLPHTYEQKKQTITILLEDFEQIRDNFGLPHTLCVYFITAEDNQVLISDSFQVEVLNNAEGL